MIKISQLSKVYTQDQDQVHALADVYLCIPGGCIFGIMGLSGAGKSTLLRCINRLEEPTSGSIDVQGEDITKFDKHQLRKYRKTVGMIFQHFNLLTRKNVHDNIAFPLVISGMKKDQIDHKVKELLDLVELSHKSSAFPAQLSGGEKQRVGIARALANDPQILLCDEPTSALDPKTTQSILKLLKKINEKLNITVVMITHQMEVIKDICHHVAVMDGGKIIEEGTVLEVFSSPVHPLTQSFVHEKGVQIPENYIPHRQAGRVSELIKIYFPTKSANEPVLSQMIKTYDVTANILAGNIGSIQRQAYGQLVVELSGSQEEIKRAKAFLLKQNLNIEVIEHARSFVAN